MIDLGLRIKELLYQKKIRKSDLARRMNKTPQSIDHLLGKSSMTTDSLQNIMEVTGISCLEIFGNVESTYKWAPELSPELNKLLEENHQLKMDYAMSKKDVAFYKAQIEEKTKMIGEKDKLIEEKERTIKLLIDQK